MSFGDYDKTVIEYISRNRFGRLILLISAAAGLLGQVGAALSPAANFAKERYVLLAGVEPTADEIKNERYVFLSGFYLRFVQESMPYALSNTDGAELLVSAESRLASTFEGTGFKYSASDFLQPEQTLTQRLNALQSIRSRAEVNADRLGERYRAMFDFGYYLAAMLQRTAEVQVRNASITELLNLATSSYDRAKENAPYRFPVLPIMAGACKGYSVTNQCVVDIATSVNIMKAYLRVHV